MGCQQFTGGGQEALSLGRQPDKPGVALQKLAAEPVFQSLHPRADQRLRRAERLGGAGEAPQLGCAQEGGDGIDVEEVHRS